MTQSAAQELQLAATAVRALTVDAVRQAGIGHVGLPLGCAEIGAVLFGQVLKHDPADPAWPDRDRFVLSAGHGSMLLYSLLHLSGYELPIEEIQNFRQLGSATPGHPEHGDTPGVETTTGPLGQGFGNAVGMALAERMLAARFGSELVDHRTYVLASDGDLMEGVASEAASLAGHLGLGRLVVFYDDNSVTIDGPADLAYSEDAARRFEAYGWDVQAVDGHNPAEVLRAIERCWESENRPHLIRCRTHIGFGSPEVDSSAAHGGIPSDSVEATRQNLGWTLEPFSVPEQARSFFRANAHRGAGERQAWEDRKKQVLSDSGLRELWRSMWERQLPDNVARHLPDFRGADPLATRQASGQILNALAPHVPSLVGGSADLAGSTNTLLKSEASVARGKFEGRVLHFGVREHAMAAAANGLALHGGIRPFVGTFLVFSDYMRPAIRLAALMGQAVSYVFSHDSIFVGEDGPTHQPVEQLAALRAIPNLEVWRPGDARETRVAWLRALERASGPTALILTRQSVPVQTAEGLEVGAARGGYAIELGPGEPELVLVASGSELWICVEAAAALNREGRRIRVASIPCLERFLAQGQAYVDEVLPPDVPRLVVEAGVELGAAPLMRRGDAFHGMTGFGASAPWKVLAEEFGFTPAQIEARARQMLA